MSYIFECELNQCKFFVPNVDNQMKKNQRNVKNRRKRSLKCPVQIGNQYNVDITNITPNGSGMTRVNGFIILVKGAQIGENKTIIITKIEHLNAEAELVA